MLQPNAYNIKRALISVSDKTGIVEFARELCARGVEVISTGGTADTLRKAGLPVKNVSDVTGFPEILGGRVKTLHPHIHAGLLGVLDNVEHSEQMEMHGLESIDMAVINLYPFEKAAANPHTTHEDIIENIDIGGPAMVRASAKNYRWTVIAVNPERYADILAEMDARQGAVGEDLRLVLAGEAFAHTAFYDSLIAQYFGIKTGANSAYPETFTVGARRAQALRYGENPHQSAALYGKFLSIFTQIHGKELSYNNIVDIDSASKLVAEFSEPTVAIIKHTNPCGVASDDSLAAAYRKAFASDTKSPFGGIIAVNRELDLPAAQVMDEIFTEVIIAPSFAPDALDLLMKKKNRRLMTVDFQALADSLGLEMKSVAGGFLLQSTDTELYNPDDFRIVTERQPSEEEKAAMIYAWKVAKHVKSNAVIYAAPDRVLAVGAGQMSRVDSARIAAWKAQEAGLDLRGSAVASEAFFPFADGLLEAVNAGATAVIQPGGSLRDDEVISAANENGIAMGMTGMRHFKH